MLLNTALASSDPAGQGGRMRSGWAAESTWVAWPASNVKIPGVPPGGVTMLWTIFVIVLLLWLLGWGFGVAGSLIHLLLVVALVVLLIELITGRRAAV